MSKSNKGKSSQSLSAVHMDGKIFLLFSIAKYRGSWNSTYKSIDKGQPCLTPLSILNSLEIYPLIRHEL